VIQVATREIGNDAVITYGGFGGVGSILELNVAMPVMADAMMESIRLLANSTSMFCDKLLADLQVNEEIATGLIEGSLMMVTSLAPVLGYDVAAGLAKEAFKEGKTIRELVREKGLLEDKELNRLLNPDRMTRPGKD
jgi:fumarate hydratase class II